MFGLFIVKILTVLSLKYNLEPIQPLLIQRIGTGDSFYRKKRIGEFFEQIPFITN